MPSIVEFREAGAAVRAAKRFVEARTGEPWRLLGGAVGQTGLDGSQVERVVKAAATAFPGQILVLPSMAAAAATAAVEVQLSEAGQDMWQIGFMREPFGGPTEAARRRRVGRAAPPASTPASPRTRPDSEQASNPGASTARR